MTDPESRQTLARLGRDEKLMSPAKTTAFIQEQRKWGPILRQIGGAP